MGYRVKRVAEALGFLVIIALTVCGGVIHGRMSGRWGTPSAMRAAGERLVELPAQIGPWKLVESRNFDESTIRELEPTGYVERTYFNKDTGERIGLMMVVGAFGPISVHTPEVCVSNQAYEISEKRREVPVKTPDAGSHSLWSVAFRSRRVDGHMLRMYYGWSTGGPWLAPENARSFFTGEPYLYKVQLSAVVPPGTAPRQPDAGQRFLRDLIPVAQKYLIPTSSE
jgi:hypothetical protein